MWSLGNESGAGAQPGRDGRLGARARPVAAAALRARLVLPRRRRLLAHVRLARGGRRDRPRRGGAARRCRAGRPAAADAVHPVRVRATRWATGRAGWPTTRRCSSATRAARAASSGSGSTTASATRARLLRLRRRLRRAAARRQLRRRRPAVPGPHAVAGAARAQEGLRAGARSRGRRGGLRIENRFTTSATSRTWRSCGSLEEEGAAVAAGELRVGSLPAGAVAELRAAGRPAGDRAGDVADRARRAGGRRAVGAGGPRGRLGPGCPVAPRRAVPRPQPTRGVLRPLVTSRWRGVRSARPACCAGSAALELIGPRLDVWRAPTDNDEGYHGPDQLGAAVARARAGPDAPPHDRGASRTATR